MRLFCTRATTPACCMAACVIGECVRVCVCVDVGLARIYVSYRIRNW